MAELLAESRRDARVQSAARQRFAGLVRAFLPYFAAIAICFVVLFRLYHLNTIDIRIPLGSVSDNLFHQALVKNFIQAHHFYVNPWLGAPGYLDLYDFPLPHWVHLAFLYVIGLFTRNFGLAINLYYFAGFGLTSSACLYAFRRLGVSAGLATAGAVLYAFLPYHLWRAEGHLFLSPYFFVPLVALVAVWLGTGKSLFRFREDGWPDVRRFISRDGLISLLACIVVSWDNAYYAFFGAYLIAIGGLLGALRYRFKQSLISTVLLLIVLVAALGIALLPTWNYARIHGPSSSAERLPVESEGYGLTILQMLAPVTNHRIAALAHWKDNYNAHGVLVNENDTATLGAVGTVGFFALLICLLLPRPSPVLLSLSILSVFATLLGTVGGFGAIFAFLISPQMRALNRISVCIAFCCIGAVVILLDKAINKAGSRYRGALSYVVVPVALLLIGLPDQIAKHQLGNRAQVESLFREDAKFVSQIESIVPRGSMIFQLPYDPFPESPPVNGMPDYDELRGYLHSKELRWSYGAMKGRPTDRWLAEVSAQPPDEMLRTIAQRGFAGVYIEREGYADHAVTLEAALRFLLNTEPLVDEGGLSFFALGPSELARLRRPMTSDDRRKLNHLLYPARAEVLDGCWAEEKDSARKWHWCGRTGEVVITNPATSEAWVVLEGSFATGRKEPAALRIAGPGYSRDLTVSDAGALWKAEVRAMPGKSVFKIECDCQRVYAPQDSRQLYFQIENFKYQDVSTQESPNPGVH
jgi:hypothetical protein